MPSRGPTKQAGWQHDACRLKLLEKGNKNVPHQVGGKKPLGVLDKGGPYKKKSGSLRTTLNPTAKPRYSAHSWALEKVRVV